MITLCVRGRHLCIPRHTVWKGALLRARFVCARFHVAWSHAGARAGEESPALASSFVLVRQATLNLVQAACAAWTVAWVGSSFWPTLTTLSLICPNRWGAQGILCKVTLCVLRRVASLRLWLCAAQDQGARKIPLHPRSVRGESGWCDLTTQCARWAVFGWSVLDFLSGLWFL